MFLSSNALETAEEEVWRLKRKRESQVSLGHDCWLLRSWLAERMVLEMYFFIVEILEREVSKYSLRSLSSDMKTWD